MTAPTLPLSGVRVVEFCQILAGPFCGCLLADLGADVVKIESPDGDGMRRWAPLRDGYSQYFAALNRNKRSVVLDFKQPASLATAKDLALAADIVIENFRPGVMQRFGLDYASLSQERPSLVYCSISAYGQDGPRAEEGGFDVTLQAMGGMMSVTGEPDGPPVKCGVPVVDATTGLYAAYSVAASLFRARATGRGEHIDVPMLGAMLGIAHLQTSELFALGRDPQRLGSAHPMNAPYGAFRCRDGYMVLAAGTDALWRTTCQVIGRPDLAADPRFASVELRARAQVALAELLEQTFVHHDVDDLIGRLSVAGVPCAAINSYSKALADPQVEHLGIVSPLALPNGVDTRTIAAPQRLSGQRPGVYRRPPGLGEHTDEVLRELSRPQTALNRARFREFVAEFTRLVERAPPEDELLDQGGELLGALVSHDDWLPVSSAQPAPDTYRQYLLYCDPLERFSVVSFVWGPGQRTPVHDHTVWGLIGVLRGAEIGRRYALSPGGGLVTHDAQLYRPGDVQAVSPRIGDIHEMANGGDGEVSISIHVYGGDIGATRRHAYDPDTGAAHSFVSGYSSAALPNFWGPEAEPER